MNTYPKEIDGMNVGNLSDELLYRMTENFPKELEVIESYYTEGRVDDGGDAFARVAFKGRVFKLAIEPEGLGRNQCLTPKVQ